MKPKIILQLLILILVSVLVGVAFAWTYTYDTATPAGSDDPAEADDRMREIKLAIQEVMNVEHDWALTGTVLTGDGKHTDITTDSITNAGALANTGNLAVNTDKFTVAAASGNTLVAGTLDVTGVATLGDASLLATSAAPTTDAMIANKKYVDDQFQSSQVEGTSNISNTSGNWADMTDMSITFTTTGGNVLLMFSGSMKVTLDNTNVELRFDLDGATQYHKLSNFDVMDTVNDYFAMSMQYLLTSLSAGSHTFKVQWKDTAGTAYQPGATYPRVFIAMESPS